MIAANFDIGWEALIAIVVTVLAVVFLAVVFLLRGRNASRLRAGVFVERETPDKEKSE